MAVININGVLFEEHVRPPGSPRPQWAQDAARVTRVYQTTAGDKETVRRSAQAILGVSRIVTVNIFNNITVNGKLVLTPVTRKVISRSSEFWDGFNVNSGILPDSYFWLDDAGNPYLYASSIGSTENLGVPGIDSDEVATYKKSRIEVSYSPRTYDVKTDTQVEAAYGPLHDDASNLGYPDEGIALETGYSNTRWITKRVRPAGKMVVLRQGLMGILGMGNAGIIQEGLPIPVPCMSVQYTWHQVPDGGVPWNAIGKQLGTVNQSPPIPADINPDPNFDGFPAETLLFEAVDPVPLRDAFGNRVWDITYSFLYLPNYSGSVATGHNHILYPKNGVLDYWPVSYLGQVAGRQPYQLSQFSNLFRPDQAPPLPVEY